MIVVQILATLLMLIDMHQTIKILKHDNFIEGNPVINILHNIVGLPGVIIFKIAIAIAPLCFATVAYIMLPLYAYIVYHNYTGFRDYNETNTNLH